MDNKKDTEKGRQFWLNAKEELRTSIDNKSYNIWINRIRYDSFNKDELTLKVDSAFIYDSITNNYLDVICKAIDNQTNEKINTKLIIKKTTNKENPEEDEAEDPLPVSKQKVSRLNSKYSYCFNPNYTFDSFVYGENSVFAFNACKAISTNPGSSYNPCLLYGGVGLGKTHLLQAIGNQLIQNSKLKVLYVTSENFTNDFINSLHTQGTQEFKNKYRKLDILLIDDIQFLEQKEQTQTELFNTFNDMYDTGRQLVFTCDRPVSELKNITSRLKNRFERGLNIDIQPPKYETRVAILQKKCEKENFIINETILDYIAKNVQSNVRDLESCLTKLKAYCNLIGKDISLEIAKEQLKDSIKINVDKNTLTIDSIIRIVANYFNVSSFDIKGKSKKKSFAMARQIAMYLSRETTDFSTTEIGQEFGGRDHTTIMYAYQKIKSQLNINNSETKTIINKMMVEIQALNTR
ncbi:MAG: chromosomal replication initiator protein DnaA [Sphaerochaetaceae bacterium]